MDTIIIVDFLEDRLKNPSENAGNIPSASLTRFREDKGFGITIPNHKALKP